MEKLIDMHKGKWKAATLDCLDEVKEELEMLVEQELEERFSRFPNMMPLLRCGAFCYQAVLK
jgi:hypothetical protein